MTAQRGISTNEKAVMLQSNKSLLLYFLIANIKKEHTIYKSLTKQSDIVWINQMVPGWVENFI